MKNQKVDSGIELLNEAKSLQKAFLKLNNYWSLESIIESIIESNHFDITPNAISSAIELAKKLDEENQ